jgi:hypothetical protein
MVEVVTIVGLLCEIQSTILRNLDVADIALNDVRFLWNSGNIQRCRCWPCVDLSPSTRPAHTAWKPDRVVRLPPGEVELDRSAELVNI